MSTQPAEHNDPVVNALHNLAQTTEVDPDFAATLEATLLERAEQMQSTERSWWHRLWMGWFAPQPARRLQQSFAILVLALVLIVATTPAARATIREWLYSFGLIEEAAVANRSIEVEPISPQAYNAMSLAELKAQAPFPVTTPTWLPMDLIFTGGFVEQDRDGTQVTLAYHLPPPQENYAPDAPILFILITNGTVDNFPLLAQEQVVPVWLNQIVGMYAHGAWQSQTPATAETTVIDNLYWDHTFDAAWLSWQIDDQSYLIYTQGLSIQQEQMVAIATSMVNK